jgi:CRISPR-associated protein (TIGR03984 family)
MSNLPENNDVRTWLESQMNEKRPTLLAFADDGVIWGRLMSNKLVTGHDQPELRESTLQQAFVFGQEDEIRLFHDELGNWKTSHVADEGDVIVESQILWGDQSEGDAQNGFLQVSEFRKGIPNQFLPVERPIGNDECVRLEVHHLIEYDEETGEARVAISRLAGLKVGKRDLEVAK